MSDTERDPGLYITVRLDHVKKVRDTSYGYTTERYRTETETLADATEQRFSPAVMAAMLRALADEVYPPKRDLPQF